MVEVKKSRRNSKFLSPIDKSSQSLTRSQSRSALLGSAQGSRVPKPPTEQKINPRIKPIYENGKEITPKPLFLIDASSTHPRLRLEDGKTVPNFQSMMTSMTGTFGGNFGATTRGTSVTIGRSFLERSTKSGIDTDLLRSEAPEDEDVASPFQQNQSRSVAFDEVWRPKSPPKPIELTPSELEIMTSVKLVETETIFYFRHEGDIANDDVENIELIGEVNHAYEKLLKSKEGNEDKFMERGMQTFNPMMKPLPGVRASTEIKQKIQTEKITFAEAGSQVSDYLLENINESSSENPTPLLASPDRINEEDLTKSSGKVGSMMMSTASASMASSKSAVISTRNKAAKIEQEKNFKNILSSPQFSNALKLVERVVSQNIHNAQVGTFRNSSALDIMGESWSLPNEVGFHTLWEYSCAETSGLVVNHVTWHPTDPDLIAVAYGFLDEDDQSRSRGLLACWTIANLEHPTRLFSFNSPVCKVSFAELQNYLAVGLYSGEISVINIKAKDSMLNTVDSQGKHMGPVWGLQWIKRERGGDEKQEVLVSAAGDGRVVQWTIRKGLEFLDLMKVKRSQPKTRKTREKKSSNTKISHFSPNTALAFSPKNDQTYLVGTEEGLIHRCSCAYNEQTLDTYKGHSGHIYSIDWHPTVDRLFASASEDWSIRIWDQKHEIPLAILLTAGQRPVFDICWSPYAQTKLLSVNDRTLEIWDYSKSILDPISSTTLNSPSKSINFAPHSDSIFLGDSDGKIIVKKTVGIRSAEDAEKVFLELVQNTFKSQKDVSK